MVLDTALLIKECRYENHIGQRIYTLIKGRIYKCIYSNYKNVKNLLLLLCGSIYKELFDEISTHCQRTMPSNRDRVLLKDLPLLVWQIVNQPNHFDENVLRS